MAASITTDHDRWPVVIVGAGPAGLTAAITLARADIRCLVIDRRRTRSIQPRATVVSLRSMELFRSWGIEHRARVGGDDVVWQMLATRTLAEAAAGQPIEVGYPTPQQSAVLSPTSPACVPQDHLETVLLDYLRELPAAEVWLEQVVEQVQQDQHSAAVGLRDLETGTRRTVLADYVIGADGARSTVRSSAGIGRQSTERLVESLSVLFHAPLWEVVGEHRFGIYTISDPAMPASFLPAGHGDRWLYAFGWDPAVEKVTDYTDDRFAAMIRAGAGIDDLPIKIDSFGAYAFVASITDRFREGRIFLAGDAAHQVTPRGGTGMNTAIADGFDLGWKLVWVTSSWAGDRLLDTYESERRPVAEHNLARSIDPWGSRRTVAAEVGVDLGGRLPHAWLPQTSRSTLDLLGSGLTLFTAGPGSALPDRSTSGPADMPNVPVTVHHLDLITARTLGLRPNASLLVRPDGISTSESELQAFALPSSAQASTQMAS
jgi:2-polyprenyl-6-methoxyphenol hydroxylase-like FAD-dependent oxidoreductase